MKLIHWLSLILLACISGSSFIFTRTVAPVLGPIVTADFRILIAGFALILYAAAIGFDMKWREHWKLYVWMGIINSGIPFLLYSFAALYIPASYLATVNASAPLFGAVFSAIWLSDKLTMPKFFGLLLGMAGVGMITYAGTTQEISPMFGTAIAACILAAMCYAFSGILIKRHAQNIKPLAIAAGSQFAAGLAMLPLCIAQPPIKPIETSVMFELLALALLCSAIAYLIYFWLIREIGPTRTLTVTFLSPFFAMLIAYLFLNEPVTAQMLQGAALIIAATVLVNYTNLFSKPKAT
jgi:drug/metabolite transporter (DMT)-like permease